MITEIYKAYLAKKKSTFEDQVQQQHEADIEAARAAAKELKERNIKNRKSLWDDDFDITGGSL